MIKCKRSSYVVGLIPVWAEPYNRFWMHSVICAPMWFSKAFVGTTPHSIPLHEAMGYRRGPERRSLWLVHHHHAIWTSTGWRAACHQACHWTCSHAWSAPGCRAWQVVYQTCTSLSPLHDADLEGNKIFCPRNSFPITLLYPRWRAETGLEVFGDPLWWRVMTLARHLWLVNNDVSKVMPWWVLGPSPLADVAHH